MSVEPYVIAAIVEEGTPKKAFQAGITVEDFEMCDDEWNWIIRRAEQRKPINPRLFKQAFPEFDFIRSRERLVDLLDELKQERVLVAVSSGIEEVLVDLDRENVVEKAMALREVLGSALKIHSAASDILMKDDWRQHARRLKELSILSENQQMAGIPTGIAHFDHHFDGLQPQTTYLVLGRPGDAKSMLLEKFGVEGAWDGRRVGLFSPEMTEHQHQCRIGTLLSAKREIQQALGLKGAFRNRALFTGRGFNLPEYRRFRAWLEENMEGEVILFNQKYRRQKQSVSYIEGKIEDFGLDMVIVDPIYKLRPPSRRGTKWEELSEIVDGLVDLAHAYNIPVLMSNQAGRALVGKRGDAPDKDSSHGGDAPVQESNCVFGVKHYSEEHIMKVNCDKNRDGEPFRFTMRFFPNIGVMEDVTPIKGGYYNGYDPDKAKELVKHLEKEEAGNA